MIKVGDIILVEFNDGRKFNGINVHPAIVVRMWNNYQINVRVLVDGHDEPLWMTSVYHKNHLPHRYYEGNIWYERD